MNNYGGPITSCEIKTNNYVDLFHNNTLRMDKRPCVVVALLIGDGQDKDFHPACRHICYIQNKGGT